MEDEKKNPKSKFEEIANDHKDSREFERLMLYEAKVAGDLYAQKIAENLDKIQNDDGSYSVDKYIAGMSQMPDLLKNKPFQKVEIPELSEERRQEISSWIQIELTKRAESQKESIFSWMKRKLGIKNT